MAVTIKSVKPKTSRVIDDAPVKHDTSIYPDANEHTPSASKDFEAIFLQHWQRVCSLLARLVGDPAEAEDLALEAFWRLYRRPPDTSPQSSLTGWLYRVAANLGYNALRAGRRRAAYEDAAGRQALERDQPLTPESEFQRQEERQDVQQALKGMKPRSAQILMLRHSGFSYAEIAEALQVAPGSVGTLLARAEKEFVKRYQGSE